MDKKERFDIRFDRDAAKEYDKLDNSIIDTVNNAIDELVFRADEIGKPLGNKASTKLAGCKEIKLREAGIRIVFRVTNETVDVLRIVYVLTIDKRNDDYVFKIADKRFKKLRLLPSSKLNECLKKARKWRE